LEEGDRGGRGPKTGSNTVEKEDIYNWYLLVNRKEGKSI
jgi:hypothetical protein